MPCFEKKTLEDLDDPDEIFTRQDFSELKKRRIEAEKLLDDYKNLESSEALEKKIETTLSSIEVQLRAIDPDHFDT